MEEFALCIEYILLQCDQVRVPGLGCFVVQQVEAKYDAKEELFLPPLRTVEYREHTARMEESNLLDAIAQIYELPADKAAEKLNLWVTDFYQQLEDCGSLDLGCIGTFSLTAKRQLSFASSLSGITSPAFYALDTVHIKPLQPMEQEAVAVPVEQSKTAISTTHESIVIRLNRRMLRYVAAASVVVVMMFSFAVPVENAQQDVMASVPTAALFAPHHLLMPSQTEPVSDAVATAAEAEPQTQEVEEALVPDSVSVAAEEVEAEVPQTVQPEAEEAVAVKPVPEEVASQTPVQSESYCIVLASAITQANAERYAEQLKARGLATARVVSGNVVRVVVGSYATAEEARAVAAELQQQQEYQGAWIYKTNE